MNKLNLLFAGVILTLAFAVTTFIVKGPTNLKTMVDPVAATTQNSSLPDVNSSNITIRRETVNNRQTDALISASIARKAPSLRTGKWINSEPQTLDSLLGRVVLVDFWTYGCYNCRNTLPTLKRFDANLRDKGLTIIGVHTPESDSEGQFANLQKAVEKLGIRYPVVTDENGDSWRAFDIEAWPTVVIVDKKGRIRFTHVGEGAYEEQEYVIKELLSEGDREPQTTRN